MTAVKNYVLLKREQHSRTPCVSIQPSSINGEGLFAQRIFKPEDIICRSDGYIVNSRIRCLEPWESRISYQLNENHHFVPTATVDSKTNALAKVNHGCNPNSYVQFETQRGFLVIKAMKNIVKGEEITCDYYATETELKHHFLCNCGMNNCRTFIYCGHKSEALRR